MFRDRMIHGERFSHGPRRASSFHKGDLKYIILDLLKERPRHGYDIIIELEEKSHGFYKPSPGVIYPTLQLLEEMGHSESTVQEGKRVYSITKEGDEFLSKKSDIANNVRSHMKHEWDFEGKGKAVMVIQEYQAMESLLSSGFKSMDDDKAEKIHQILSQASQEIESILQESDK